MSWAGLPLLAPVFCDLRVGLFKLYGDRGHLVMINPSDLIFSMCLKNSHIPQNIGDQRGQSACLTCSNVSRSDDREAGLGIETARYCLSGTMGICQSLPYSISSGLSWDYWLRLSSSIRQKSSRGPHSEIFHQALAFLQALCLESPLALGLLIA